jgi:hypothetical protein
MVTGNKGAGSVRENRSSSWGLAHNDWFLALETPHASDLCGVKPKQRWSEHFPVENIGVFSETLYFKLLESRRGGSSGGGGNKKGRLSWI